MKFRVLTLWTADTDVRKAFDYIRRQSPDGSARWLKAFDSALDRLRQAADTFGEAAESSMLEAPVREVMFGTRRGLTYRIIFRIQGDEVHVLRVRGPGQAPIDPSDLPDQ